MKNYYDQALLATPGEVDSVVMVVMVDGDMEWVPLDIMGDRVTEWGLEEIMVDTGRLQICFYDYRMKNIRDIIASCFSGWGADNDTTIINN